MNQLAKQILLRAAALATVLALGACGGGGDSSPQQPAAQSITFTSPGDQALGVTPAALVATSTSGLTVSFASGTPGVCTVLGTALRSPDGVWQLNKERLPRELSTGQCVPFE